jgi:hypothetical protein
MSTPAFSGGYIAAPYCYRAPVAIEADPPPQR